MNMNATRPTGWLFIVATALVLVGLAAGSTDAGPITNGLQLWLDATDISTFTFDPSSSTNVKQWRDKSGHLHHANAGTMMPLYVSNPDPNLNPIGNKPAVLFRRTTGDSTALTLAGDFQIVANGGRSVFIVMKYTTPSTSNYILGTSLQAVVDVGDGNERMRLRNFSTVAYSPDGTVPGDQDTLLSIRSDQGAPHTTTAYHNGSLIIDEDTYAFHWPIYTNLQVGGANYNTNAYQGFIAEVLLYNRTLSDNDMHSVGYYLQQKYGLLAGGGYGVPEPSTLLLAAVGLLCAFGWRRGKKSGR